MKTKILQSMLVVLAVFTVVTAQAETTYKPFALASNDAGKVADKLESTKKALQDNGFTIAGDYAPYEGAHV
ncbi:MAG: hypothetical protein OQL09_02845, partial [Gammaproteobacteria bacterium]|nr:hypothetical protein [Gammaproteobacteria bacterium]